ncbi:putative indole-3-pyruvate monooxygenase [Helianthus anomalus]
MPFPEDFPTYPDKQHFVDYLEAYAKRFGIDPVFDSSVERAEYDESIGMWRVKSVGMKGEEVEYVCSLRMASCGCRRKCGGGGAGD